MKEKSTLEQRALGFDSTQTLRALTDRELRDPSQQKWFAVQFVVSDRPVNLETMPRLDAFAAHRLYAIEGRQGNSVRYALRLGFFTHEETAQRICDDAKAFFRSPCVVRVSAGEQARFDAPVKVVAPPEKQLAPRADVIDLTSVRRPAPNRPPEVRKSSSPSPKLKLDKSLSRELMKEAREVELSRSGSYRVPQRKESWITKLLGRPKR